MIVTLYGHDAEGRKVAVHPLTGAQLVDLEYALAVRANEWLEANGLDELAARCPNWMPIG